MKKGFTLMEILIVIAIIGILVSISAVSYSSAQKRGRDSRRRNDMKAYQNAWEQYYGDNNSNYPSSCAYSVTPTAGVMSGAYFPAGLPVDPKAPTPYPNINAGWSSCSTSEYCFCAGLEGETNATANCAAATTPPAGYTGIFCVKNLQ